MPASIDLRKAHLHRTHGDLVVVFSWLNDQRAMFLIPRYRNKAPWYVLLDSAAYEWDDEEPGNVPLVAAKAMKACEVLGIEPTSQNARRIAGIIIDSLPDLIRMPSAPVAEKFETGFGEVKVMANGEQIGGEVIKLEKDGVEYE